MRILVLILTISLFSTKGHSQKYDVASIPEHLLKNANAVVRWEEGHYDISGLHNASYTWHEVVTILRQGGAHYADEQIWYDPDSEIVNLEATVYDANGEEINKLRKKDIYDGTYSSLGSFGDSRFKYIDLASKNYPYTVEFKYKKNYKNLFYTKDWYTLQSNGTALEHSKYTISAPKDLMPNFRVMNSDVVPKKGIEKGKETISFLFENISADKREPFGTSVYKQAPHILVSPKKFDFDGYTGSFDTWDAFSAWMSQLIADRAELTPEVIADIKALTDSLTTTEAKIKKVYEYMQNNTRYVSIQLGIGGYQPFPAMMVNEKGYGDCKALSNYTHAMLTAIGIPSYHVLIDGGDNPRPIIKDFPNNTFNHMILCAPNAGDTLWLECTSQTNSFGYQGEFTGDRDVLLITPDGGKIVHTTIYEKEDNLQTRTAIVKIQEDGNGSASIETHFQGLQHENANLNHYVNEGAETQKKWLLENIDIPNFDLNKFSFKVNKGKIPSIDQSIEVTLRNYAQSSEERLFVPLNLMNRQTYVPKRVSDRKTPIKIETAFIDVDSIIYELPETLHSEYTPEPIEFTSEFGEYKSSVTLSNGQLIYVRKFGMNKGEYPKESYEDFRSFFKKVKKADKAKVVFIKST